MNPDKLDHLTSPDHQRQFSPAPGAAPLVQQVRAQARMETRLLLRNGELLEVCRDLRVVAYEDGFLDEPPRFVQRIAALRPQPGQGRARHRLQIESAFPERTRQ